MMKPHLFMKLCDVYGKSDIDLFATRINHQLDQPLRSQHWHTPSRGWLLLRMALGWHPGRYGGGRYWIALDATDGKVALQESKKGAKWDGDVNVVDK